MEPRQSFRTARSRALAGAAGATVAALLAWAPATPLAAQGAELDGGRYEIREGERRVGTETFGIRREGGRIRAAGRVVLDDADGSRTLNVALQLDGDLRPTQYVLRSTAGPVSGVDGAWNGDRLRLHVATGEGERWKEFMTPGRVAVLEEGVAHHFHVLFRQLPDDPAGSSIAVIVPSRNEQATASVRGGTADAVQVGSEQRQATRYEVQVAGGTYRVWVDAQRRVLRVEQAGRNRAWIRLPGS